MIRSRLLTGAIPPSPLRSNANNPPETNIEALDSDFVVIIAALLCALICVLGLAVVARCAWIRRIAGRDPAAPPPSANKGVKKKVLRSLPKVTYGGGAEQAATLSADCAICLAEFTAGEEVRVLPQCGHGFHVACIDTWLNCHSSCPSCRRVLTAPPPPPPLCQKCGREAEDACSGGGAPPAETRVRLG